MTNSVLVSKLILALVCSALLSCGVKGPPEPPLPTEGSLKKEQKEKEEQEEQDKETSVRKKSKSP